MCLDSSSTGTIHQDGEAAQIVGFERKSVKYSSLRYYKAQLEQSGCVLTGEDQGGPLAWINWTLNDGGKQCHGFFMILKEVDQEYYIHLRMKCPNRGKTTTEK